MGIILLLTDAGDQRRPGPDYPGHCQHPCQHDNDGRNVLPTGHGEVSAIMIFLSKLFFFQIDT